MIDIGINYITEKERPQNRYDDIYIFLLNKGYINTIKFPGKYCDFETLDKCQELIRKTNAKIDIHGLPGIIPSIYSKEFIKNVNWDKIKLKNVTRISTHMGLENKDTLNNYSKEELNYVVTENIKNLKENLKKISNRNIEIGLENIPGGFEFDKQTLTPQYVTQSWKIADFGVFDISHAKLAAKQINLTYDEYINNLEEKEKVKILHVSGNISSKKEYINKPDKHVLINVNEIDEIINAINFFNNIDLIISEYAYKTQYSYKKELLIESIVLYMTVKFKNKKKSEKVLKFLEENVEDDGKNIKELLSSTEWKNVEKIR